jgi:hypothetical protein
VSIKEKATEIKGALGALPLSSHRWGGVLSVGIMLLVSVCSFVSGRMSVEQAPTLPEPVPMTIVVATTTGVEGGNETNTHTSTRVDTASSTPPGTEGTYVGSRKGTKYHLPWCAGAKTISEENKVWFQSKEEAVSRGYTPAQNCKGI